MSRFLIPLLLFGIALPGCGGCSSQTQVDEIIPEKKPESVAAPKFAKDDSPWWRGIQRNGIVKDDATYPVKWSKSENVVWKAQVPGRGLSSPVVVGNRVFLTTAEKQREVQTVLCYNRQSGDLQWRKDVHHGNLGDKGHTDSTYASATIACDGERVFAVFKNDGQIQVTALTVGGKQLWQTPVGRHKADHGFGTSPLIYKELVILAADSKSYGFIAGLHRKTGEIHWRRKRPATDSYATPVVATLAGEDQVLLSGGGKVISYDPLNGNTKWSIDAGTRTMCGTITWEGDTAFVSGGYPDRETAGIRVKGDDAEVIWRNSRKFYVPSILAYDGCLYGNDYSDVLYCLDAKTGEVNWRHRPRGSSYGSPIFAGGHIYIPLRRGKVIVIKPSAKKYDEVAVNTLGSAMDTTPTACGGKLYLRVVDGSTGWLYCIGK